MINLCHKRAKRSATFENCTVDRMLQFDVSYRSLYNTYMHTLKSASLITSVLYTMPRALTQAQFLTALTMTDTTSLGVQA